MKKFKASKGFKTILAGLPDLSMIRLPEPETVAVSAMDIPYIRPRLLVKEWDRVKIGTPLFCDKRNPCIVYVAPASGTVQKIVFGTRRALIEIVILIDKTTDKTDAIRFDPIDETTLNKIPKADLIKRLQEGGLWQCFREFPFKDSADEHHTPPMIIVSLNGNDPFSPHPGLALENESSFFEFGLKVLNQLTDKVIVSTRHSSRDRLGAIQESVTHVAPDVFPAWDPGVVLYHEKTSIEENRSWCISAEHLVLVAKFMLIGVYPIKRVVTVTRPHDKKPHIITRQGAPIKNLAGQLQPNSIITTGRFNGRVADPDTHLGFFESTLNIINQSPTEELLGFLQPGFSKPSVSHTFASSLLGRPQDLDCNLHGEERACINCGYCTKICPVDLMPSFIMKALHSDDIEDALNLGLLDCCRCGLCSYTCPSKIELTHILSQGMDTHYKDKE
ncbi:MAG: 4Fe-4S dicluster domain-containing protein [Pseudomonadota bacterium]